MKSLELFYQSGCPYCVNARRAVDELISEHPEYAAVPIRWINENAERALADSRDYWYVPTVYCDGEKLYETSPGHDYQTIRDNIQRSFEQALK